MATDPAFRLLGNKLCALAASDRELSQGAKLLLDKITMLADWAQGRSGLCFPGYARLAELVGRSVRMIGHYLRELRERGYLSWSRQQRCPNVYFLNLDRVSAAAPPIPDGLKLASKGYPFAGGRYNRPGVRELLRGAAALRAGAGVQPEPSRAIAERQALDGGPPILGRLSASILSTFGRV